MKKTYSVEMIKRENRQTYQLIDSENRDSAKLFFLRCEYHLRHGNFTKAYRYTQQLFHLANRPLTDATALFHNLLFAEDVITPHTMVLINKASPYFESLNHIATELQFTVKAHSHSHGNWTRDYIISLGENVLTLAKQKKDNYIDDSFMLETKKNTGIYYGKLDLKEHHQAKEYMSTPADWVLQTQHLFAHTRFLKKTMLEGGNFFCAINKVGKRFYIVGENVVSETIAYNKISREEAIRVITEEIACPIDQLIVIPQWAYHLDLQMAYIGNAQFIIHSFNQEEFNFDLDDEEQAKIEATFAYLHQLFEKDIIDMICQLLSESDFEVAKVWGNLFYMNDCTDDEEKKFIPYCKSSDGFDGACALMMNGVAVNYGPDNRHYLVARCDITPFKQQFETSLKNLGIKQIHEVDMMGCYDFNGDFEGITQGIFNARNVTHVAATMNGALRCQTSIVSKSIVPLQKQQIKASFFQPSKKQVTDENDPSILKINHCVEVA